MSANAGIAAAQAYLRSDILQGLAITAPVPLTIKKAWPYWPPRSKALADVPSAIATWEQRPVKFGSALLQKPYTFHVQIFAAKQTDSLGPEKAAAFMDALVTKLASTPAAIRLGSENTVVQELRGESPETLTVLEWGGQWFIGLDLYIDISMTAVPGYSS